MKTNWKKSHFILFLKHATRYMQYHVHIIIDTLWYPLHTNAQENINEEREIWYRTIVPQPLSLSLSAQQSWNKDLHHASTALSSSSCPSQGYLVVSVPLQGVPVLDKRHNFNGLAFTSTYGTLIQMVNYPFSICFRW